jgi:acetyl esterase/lipase
MQWKSQISSWLCYLTMAALPLLAQRPPAQPTSGPGGSNYSYASYTKLGPFYPAGSEGNPALLYLIYQPASPQPQTAPVVLFLHGYPVTDPSYYEQWMIHICRKGYTVVFAQYMDDLLNSLPYGTNAQASYRDALTRLQSGGSYVKPATDGSGKILSGIVGHSLGGYLSVNVAALAGEANSGIPMPKGIFAIEPSNGVTLPADYSLIPSTTQIVMAAGQSDTVVCTSGSTTLWDLLPQVNPSNKIFVTIPSDSHGKPMLVADHTFPVTYPAPMNAQVNALDYYGTWKLSVGTLNCSIYGSDCDYAVAQGTPNQLSMGAWSDGVPVKPMNWYGTPDNSSISCSTAR